MRVEIEIGLKRGTKTLYGEVPEPGDSILIFIIFGYVESVRASIPVEYIIFPDGESKNAKDMKQNVPEGMLLVELKADPLSNEKRMLFKLSNERLKGGFIGIKDDYCLEKLMSSTRVEEDGWKLK